MFKQIAFLITVLSFGCAGTGWKSGSSVQGKSKKEGRSLASTEEMLHEVADGSNLVFRKEIKIPHSMVHNTRHISGPGHHEGHYEIKNLLFYEGDVYFGSTWGAESLESEKKVIKSRFSGVVCELLVSPSPAEGIFEVGKSFELKAVENSEGIRDITVIYINAPSTGFFNHNYFRCSRLGDDDSSITKSDFKSAVGVWLDIVE